MYKKSNTLLAAIFAILVTSVAAIAETAVTFDYNNSAGGWPVGGSNYGWQFTVNQNIKLTHLGLYDDWPNGFSIDHPIGLWRLNDGTLLASGTMSAGTSDTLINHFRYIDVPDVQLSVGVNYVVGYYTSSDHSDYMITEASSLQVNPVVNLVVGRWDISGRFQMPANLNVPNPLEPFMPHDFGPNFLFEVPEPATLLLLGAGAMMLRRRNRK